MNIKKIVIVFWIYFTRNIIFFSYVFYQVFLKLIFNQCYIWVTPGLHMKVCRLLEFGALFGLRIYKFCDYNCAMVVWVCVVIFCLFSHCGVSCSADVGLSHISALANMMIRRVNQVLCGMWLNYWVSDLSWREQHHFPKCNHSCPWDRRSNTQETELGSAKSSSHTELSCIC